MSLRDLGERAEENDGVAPFNEATLLAIAAGDEPRTDISLTTPDGVVVAAAYAIGDSPVELVVDPRFRRGGLGRKVLDAALDEGERAFWAHGDLDVARRLASSTGFAPARTLLVLRRELDEPPEAERVPEGVSIRTFEPADVDAIVEVNARSFAAHPEQGAMDRADFERRAASDWFDPAGLFVAVRDGRVVGFHWTKAEDGVGEVYVVGVDPSEQGSGLGTALTARGIRHLQENGLHIVDLYVEGDNAPALAVYHRLGFTERARDVLYTR